MVERIKVLILDFFGVVYNPATTQPTIGLNEFLERVQRLGLKCGIASSTFHQHINNWLQQQQLNKYISVIVGADDVVATKPNPECYQRVAEYFGAAPAECLVIDDSISAITAAAAAGFQTIYFGKNLGGSAAAAIPALDNFEKIAKLINL